MTATDDLIERFRREYQDFHSISDERAREQRKLLGVFAGEIAPAPLTEATAGDFQGFLGAMVKSGLHVNTVRKKANMIRPFFGWLFATSRIDADTYLRLKSVDDPRGSTARSKPRPYKRAELDAFYALLDANLPLLPKAGSGSTLLKRWITGKTKWPRVARHAMRLQVDAIVALALHCGLRRFEVFQLKPDDLHYDNAYIVVVGKGKKVREVPFTEPARDAVKAWLDFRTLMRPECAETWLSCYGPTFNHAMRFERFKELLSKVVAPGWQLHRFRHTFATERLRAGTPLEIVSTVLGHSTLEQTRCYAEIVKQDVARALEKSELEFVERVVNRAA